MYAIRSYYEPCGLAVFVCPRSIEGHIQHKRETEKRFKNHRPALCESASARQVSQVESYRTQNMNRDCRKPVGVESESHSWDNACVQVDVITSYSIHYTKLYDRLRQGWRNPAAHRQGSRARRSAPASRRRTARMTMTTWHASPATLPGRRAARRNNFV